MSKENLTLNETFDLALKNQQENNLQDAQNYYQKVLKIDPNFLPAHNNLGIIFKGLGKIQKAKDCYEKAIEISPHNSDAHNNLGNIFKELGDYNKTKDCYEKAIEIDPNHVNAHNNLGAIFGDLGETQKAKDCFTKAIKLKPNYADGYNNLGMILRELNKLEEAETSFKKAIELKPDYADAYDNLGKILKELNRLEEAETSFKKARIFNPDFIEIIKNINKGDWQNSKYLLEKMSTLKIIDMNQNVREFIRIWCVYCHKLLIQGDIKRLTKILTKLFIIGERNQDMNDLIKSFFDAIDIVKALELVELNDKILIKVSYCQYKFLTRDFALSESLAVSNIKEAPNLIVNPKTTDLGWLIVRRSLALCKNKNIAREALNNLTANLELIK